MNIPQVETGAPHVVGPQFVQPGPLNTINHQAAGIELGCAGCTSQTIQLRDAGTALPMWAKVLAVMAAIGIVLAVVNVIASVKDRRAF